MGEGSELVSFFSPRFDDGLMGGSGGVELPSLLVSFFSLRFDDGLMGGSKGVELPSLPLNISSPHGTLLLLRFEALFQLLILLVVELLSFIVGS